MVVVPLQRPENEPRKTPDAAQDGSMNWVGYAAGGAMVAAGLLLLTGQRRAGMVAAASGTALALLDQQELLKKWFESLPGYIDEVQGVLGRVQETVDDLASRRETLVRILYRATPS